MKKIYHIIILAVVLLTGLSAQALTPAQVLDKSASALLKAKGVTAAYTLTAGGAKEQGTIQAKGKKFHISAGGIDTWYDGSTQWNYSRASQEVTVSRPTAAEVATASPYALVASYKTHYNLAPQKSKIPGTYAILLTPKSKSNPLRSAVIYVRSKDFLPCRLDMKARDGSASSIIITSIKTGVNLPESTFVFQKKKYPKAEVIDLR